MLRKRFDPFVLAVAALALLATFTAISPSSYSAVLRGFGAEDDGIVLGRPQGIRSDEYALWTPMVQAAVNDGFTQINETSIYRENRRHFYALPLYDWGLALKPNFWPFLILPAANAYAAYFAIQTFLFLVGYYLLARRFGTSGLDAGLAALILYYCAYTQSWWTSLGHHIAVFPWIPLIFLASLRPLPRFLLATLATGAWFLAGTFYPPLVFTLLLLGLLGVWVFRPETLRIAAEKTRLLAMVAGLAAGALLAYLYLREPLAAALASSGHGQRNVSGGHVPWQDFLALFLPGFPYRGSVFLSGSNYCEGAAAGSYLWLLLLVFLDYGRTRANLRALPDHRAFWWRAGALVAAFLLLAAWMLLPIPAWAGQLFLWTKFPNTRLLFPAGLLCLWLALFLLPHLRLRASWPRFGLLAALSVAFWWPSRVRPTFDLLLAREPREAIRFEWIEHANTDLYPLGLVLLAVVLAFLLRRYLAPSRWVQASTALAIAALSNLLTFVDFNPWMSARPIFDRPQTEHTQRLVELQEAHPQRWLVIGDWKHLGHILNGYGFRSVNHAFIVPETRLLRERFPHLDPGLFHFIFNRYVLIQIGLYEPPDYQKRLQNPMFWGGDLSYVPADAFLPETRVELKSGPPPPGLPEKGRVRALNLDGRLLEISLEGEISGTTGKSAVELYLDRPGKIAERWLRPRGEEFDAREGLRLFSRLDLKIELETPPADLAELGLGVVTRDPTFGDFVLAAAPPAHP